MVGKSGFSQPICLQQKSTVYHTGHRSGDGSCSCHLEYNNECRVDWRTYTDSSIMAKIISGAGQQGMGA